MYVEIPVISHHLIPQAPPMQGFFGKPVDNLHAEPLIARWIRHNIKSWQDAVVVSKNPGGSKRVTSLADALKLNFGIITTDRRRHPLIESSMILNTLMGLDASSDDRQTNDSPQILRTHEESPVEMDDETPLNEGPTRTLASSNDLQATSSSAWLTRENANGLRSSPPQKSNSTDSGSPRPMSRLQRSQTAPSPLRALRPVDAESDEQYTDERAREVITGRLVRGHIVDDDFPSPMLSTMSGSMANIANLTEEQLGPSHFDESRDPMTASFMSAASSMEPNNTISGTFDQAALSDDDEENKLIDPEVEHTVTLVGNVNQKTVIIIDDIMDRSESWIAAAETVVKRGGAAKVYCIATHGVFGDNSLVELNSCDCIDTIVVCDTFPLDPAEASQAHKLVVLSMAGMLAEAIRRNQYGESISHLYQYYQD